MDLPNSQTSSNDDETRALNALLDAFSCAFSLEDIATAYCKANGDVNRAGDLLTGLELSMGKSNAVDPSVGTILPHIDKAVEETFTKNSGQARSREKLQQKCSASFGTVSCMLEKGSTRATASVNRITGKEKHPMVELPEYMRDDFNVKNEKSDSAPKKETLNNRDIEEFLFSMLGEGFKLSMEMIREVLGSCGYDIKKSMEELLSVSAKDHDKKAEDKHNVAHDSAVECSSTKGSCIEPQSTSRNCSASSSQGERHSSRSQISPGELLEAIFTVPERSVEEPIRKRIELGANRSRVLNQKPVIEPLEDISSQSTDFPVKVILVNKEPVADNDDDYQNYRRAAKQHWDMMKQYYEKAADAFKVGNQKEVEYLLGEGKHYYSMARLAVEKSSGEIVKSKKIESKNELCLDLRGQDPANVANLVRLHLRQLSNIPSFDYLKVIIGAEDGSFKAGQRRRKVMKYLEKKSIVWTEDEANPGTILIPINQMQDQQT
ncbi:hypothetical protein GUJ93_ZPchr0006g46143 [Zizania palustris]|uniref:DUF1771 domain-containing protein n=1 Tax=Zizania palustris TaxID=103762 RepID=A0A8J5SU80_ZIZPA|nr:hypothetical protein GUJ93_ZPchr0006g46143 [Zizania palustris]